VIVKITTLKNSLHILQHGHVVKVQKSLHASFYDVSSSSVKDVVKYIVISSFYNVVTAPTSLVPKKTNPHKQLNGYKAKERWGNQS
jgi:hypothetical protein